MVRAMKGTLLLSDPSVKQIILRLNREHNFIIQDIDDSTLFVRSEHLAMIEEETEKMLNYITRQNTE